MKDSTAPLYDKLKAMEKFRQPLSAAPDKSGQILKFLGSIERDTPLEKVTAALGIPDGRKTFDIKVKAKKRGYSFARYDRDDVLIYVISDKSIRGIAMSLKETASEDARYPVVNFSFDQTVDFGAITLGYLRDKCDGSLSRPDARFLYTTLPPCSFGNASAGSFFIFGFDAWTALAKGGDPTAVNRVEGRLLSDFHVTGFDDTRVNFVLIHLYDPTDQGGYTAEAIAQVVLRDIYWRQFD